MQRPLRMDDSIRSYIPSKEILLLFGKKQARNNDDPQAYRYGIRTFTSGRLSTCTVSINLTLLLLSFITSDEVRAPSPKKRTPLSSGPSVTPVAAKMMFVPGASPSAV